MYYLNPILVEHSVILSISVFLILIFKHQQYMFLLSE